MKKQILSLALFVLTSGAFFAQTQGGINYKALINENGNVIQNQSVTVKFTILENGNTSVYEETHTTTTDANGILIVNIGEGTAVSGNFTSIDWSNDEFLNVQIDTGNGYTDMGTTAFKYVPKAKYADKAGNVPTSVSSLVNDAGYITTETDGDTTNELQTLTLAGNQLSISNGNSITLPSGTTGTTYTAGAGITINGNNEIINTGDTDASDDFSGNYADLNGAPTNVSSFTNDAGYLTSELDGDATNELQSLNLNGSQLSISNGNTITLPTGTTYTAGTGIAINGNNEIINTGDTDASDDFSGNYADLNGAPTNVSSFVNDAGYAQVINDLADAKTDSTSIFMGKYSGSSSNSTAIGNTGIGFNNLSSTTSGQRNTAIGLNSLKNNTTGNANTAIGEYSLSNITTQGGNTAIGAHAGALATGRSNIFIGFFAGESETGSNKLIINNNYSSTPLISGDFASRDVAIDGDLTVTGKVLGNVSGIADMRAYIYGYIYSSGATGFVGGTTDGFTVNKIGTGLYEIIFNTPLSNTKYDVVSTITGTTPGFITVSLSATKFTIRTFNTSGALANRAFNFVVYKK